MTVHDLSDALIARALDAEGWDYAHTPDGQITLTFGDASFVTSVQGDVLLTHGLIDAAFTPSQAAAVEDVLDEWHRSRPWPKAVMLVGDTVHVMAECAGYFPSGLTLEQTRTQLRCAVGSTSALARELAAI